MDANFDDKDGIWKSARGKGRHALKDGRTQDEAAAEIRALLGTPPFRAIC